MPHASPSTALLTSPAWLTALREGSCQVARANTTPTSGHASAAALGMLVAVPKSAEVATTAAPTKRLMISTFDLASHSY